MMYQAYPELTEQERLAGLEPLDLGGGGGTGVLGGCCRLDGLDLPDAAAVWDFRVEMLLGVPVLRLDASAPGVAPGASLWNLRTGERVGVLSAGEAARVAAEYGARHALGGPPRALGTLDIDQWTVQDARRNQPVYHFAFDDTAGTEIYVSAASGKVFQDTNRRERFLAWLGAIPHWLYPLELRQNARLWTAVVVWTSALGTFLTLTGLAVGVWRFRPRAAPGRRSPFRGWWYWHHIGGLVFGVLTLTWVFSGLMTMDPWRVFFDGGVGYESGIRGGTTWAEVRRFLAAAPGLVRDRDLAELQAAPVVGRLYVLAVRADGEATRLDASGRPARPLERFAVVSALGHLEVPVKALTLLDREDSFYYGARGPDAWPVYRAVLDDADETRLYVNRTTGAVVAVGAGARASRWIIGGLHDIDFAVLRARPLWDVAVLALLLGVTAVSVTGTWLALKRVRLDFRRMRRRLLHRRIGIPSAEC
jgi:hypothetical protein